MVTSPPPTKNRQLPEMMEKIQIEDVEPYRPTMDDELDEQFARVVNASPIQMKVQRLGEGKYYFGGRMVEQPGGSLTMTGGKVVLCRLMEYGRIVSGSQSGAGEDSGVSSGGSHSGSTDDGLQNVQQPINRPPSSLSSASSAQMDPRRNGGGLATIYSNGSLAALQKAEAAETTTKKRQSKVMVRVGGGWQDLDIFLLDHSFLANESVVVRAV